MKLTARLLLLCSLLAVYSHSWADPVIHSVKKLNNTITQFERSAWEITLTAAYTNPYNQKQVSLDMLLVSPTGKPLLLPCYFDNGTWKARFTPQEAGIYQYTFRLTDSSAVTTTVNTRFTVQPGTGKGFLHKNDLWTFRFDNGELFRGIGENVAWESRSFEDDKWTYDYLLPSLARNGANFFRTWMCYWNLPLEWKKPHGTKRYQSSDAYFNPGAIKRMDELVDMCDSLGLYFMLSIDWHGHLMQGGGWNNSNYNQKNGGPAKDPADFFTMQAAQEQYKNKLRYIVARWGYSPSIAVWEFFNEVDNAAFTPQDSIIIPLGTIAQWHLEMSRYLKDIDPYQHLVSTSVSHRDIIGLNSIPYIDFNQKHIYKHTEKIPGIYPDYIQTYNKPYVVGEFGFRWEDQDVKYAKEANYDYKRGLWYGMFSPTPILPMSWWWEMFDNEKMTPYFRSVRMISDRMLRDGQGNFEKITVSAGTLEAYALKCGDSYYVYLLNHNDSTQTSSIRLSLPANYRLQQFSPATHSMENKTFAVADNDIRIPGFALAGKQETILIFSKDK
ncbi:DUF5060 domain-containing protein [Chitinophaga sp. MM2321]|uniref:DUF5060 domain-containing protein n=1 Tax=Chitinophaga sp. MM2321 TaxID=3137178 RepID=UPI0032D58447